MKLFDRLRGLTDVKIGAKNAKSFISHMIKAKIPFGSIKTEDGGDVSFFIRRKDAPAVFEAAAKLGADVVMRERGLPAFFKRHKLRLGIPIGALGALFLIFFSSRFVWDIKIPDMPDIERDKIEEALSSHGFFLGAYLPDLDIGDICKRIAAENENVSWISVNMSGTVAYVEARSPRSKSVEDVSRPSNLVASCDGQIVLVEAVGGKSEVKAGQTVRKGDVLVSGVIDSPALGYRLVRSRGRVLADVSKTFSAEQPTTVVEKTYTGAQKTKKYVNFFSKNAEIEKNIDVSFEKYDIIEETKRLTLLGTDLPIFLTTVTYAEYTESELTVTEEEARRRAAAIVEEKIDGALSGNDIFNRYEKTDFDGERVRLTVTVECRIDIAEEQIILTEKK